LWLQNIDFKDFVCKFFEMKILWGIERYSVRAASLELSASGPSAQKQKAARVRSPF